MDEKEVEEGLEDFIKTCVSKDAPTGASGPGFDNVSVCLIELK